MSRPILILVLGLLFTVPVFTQWQPDTNRIIQAWKYDPEKCSIDTIKIDTLLPYFQLHNPVWKSSFTSTYCGNLGTAAESNIPFERSNKTGFILFQPLQDYMLLPTDSWYIHTKKPFTQLNYVSGGPKATGEQTLQVLHTQNVNQFLNFVIRYNLYSSGGQYPNQKAKNNAFSFSMNYLRNRYAAHGSFVVNKFDIQENGGIVGDTVQAPSDYTWIPVNLQNAGNRYLNVSFFLTQSVGFGHFPWQKNDSTKSENENFLSSIHYTVQYDRFYRQYYDLNVKKPTLNGGSTPDSVYYSELSLRVSSIIDSVFWRRFTHSLQLQLHESPGAWFRLKGNVGIFNEIFSYLNYQAMPRNPFSPGHFNGTPELHNFRSDLTEFVSNPYSRNLYNIGLKAFIQNEAGSHFAWNASGTYYLMGYNARDYDLRVSLLGTFSGQWAAIQAGRSVHRAEYYLREYQSGSYSWNYTGLGLSTTPSGTTFAGVTTKGKIIDFTGEVRLYDHYIYLTKTSPAQASGAFATVSAVAGRTFKLGRLYSGFNAAVQYSGSDYLHLPLVAANNTTWFEQSLVKDVLMSNLGFEVYYFTPYFADGYNPALGLFYTQQTFKSGNYPYLNVFLNLKLKTVRLMLKYDHVNSGLLPRTYFTAMHYPMQARVLKFGISWNFYD